MNSKRQVWLSRSKRHANLHMKKETRIRISSASQHTIPVRMPSSSSNAGCRRHKQTMGSSPKTYRIVQAPGHADTSPLSSNDQRKTPSLTLETASPTKEPTHFPAACKNDPRPVQALLPASEWPVSTPSRATTSVKLLPQ